jgi:hypothetical protein
VLSGARTDRRDRLVIDIGAGVTVRSSGQARTSSTCPPDRSFGIDPGCFRPIVMGGFAASAPGSAD